MHRKTDEEWLNTPWDELGETRKRRIVLLEANYTCSQCGFSQRRNDGFSIIEVDHIDGNHLNNAKENLRALCPNCHALTPNFRNYARKGHQKSSTRFRRENKGYKLVRQLVKEKEIAYIESLRSIVYDTHASGEIDYSQFGWVQRLSEKLNDPNPQVVGRLVRRFFPQFYVENCFRRRGGCKVLPFDKTASNGV